MHTKVCWLHVAKFYQQTSCNCLCAVVSFCCMISTATYWTKRLTYLDFLASDQGPCSFVGYSITLYSLLTICLCKRNQILKLANIQHNYKWTKATALNSSTGELPNARISITNSCALLSVSKKIAYLFKQITTYAVCSERVPLFEGTRTVKSLCTINMCSTDTISVIDCCCPLI